jgi:hypothetical protein
MDSNLVKRHIPALEEHDKLLSKLLSKNLETLQQHPKLTSGFDWTRK